MTHEMRGVRIEKYALFCQQTSPKRWFGNMDMSSNCDVTNSAHQIQMTTIWPWTKNPHENFLRTPLIQTHFGSSLPASSTKQFWAQFHDLCAQKRSCLLWNWDVFWKFSACKIYKKGCGYNSTLYVPKNKAVCHGIQTHSGRSLPTRFTENVLGAIPGLVRPKAKLFAVKFRRILEVLCLRVLRKVVGAIPRFLC